ncbi:capsule biosynthesis protein [Jannaschia sp. W003]|uniref:capsule biosynthesis protein n=1 Tax=Jannaschia sp. W003 TaxID=2867012 RepID=UPI0021A3BBFD|nr:capsule biosynthesis protein [Jannaschia sp. W003]UWQ20965.1 capsule biosynthesis protein [Jannaschia sp. W003]
MTTHPRARAFRTRPDQSFAPSSAALSAVAAPGPPANAAGEPPASRAPAAAAPPPAVPAATDVPPVEALTGRQLRIARRVAQKHGVKAGSDHEAVAILRERGIDPLGGANMLQVVPQPGETLPSTAPAPRSPPVPADGGGRAAEIVLIQRDIARRRRRRVFLLAVRLLFFVGLPTAIAGYYYAEVATPMYATKSEFVIQQADAAGAAAGGGLFAGTGLASQPDSIAVQGYLLSRDAYLRLDADQDFRAHFSAPGIDPLNRLDPDATQDEAYALYKRMVDIGYDPTEGLVRMEVAAADPAVSASFSRALIDYAEEQVDQLTARKRDDQMDGARESYEDAEAKMLAAQNRVVALQEQLGVVSAESELGNVYGQISAIETALREERLGLEALLANRRPNGTRVQVAESRIAQLESELAGLRQGLTDSGGADASNLARVTAELGVAQMDLQTRQLLLQQAATQMETARIEANRQVRYLSTPVPPVPPDTPTYPRVFENTVLAFLIFSGLYLMISLTSAILREQVSG